MNSVFGFYAISFGVLLIPLWGFNAEPMIELTSRNVTFILTNAGFTVMFFLVFAFGLSVSSPLYLSISTLLSLPVSTIADALLNKINISALGGTGVAAIVVGILIINIHNWWIHDQEQELENKTYRYMDDFVGSESVAQSDVPGYLSDDN